jgi:ubiquitin-like protein ATG12
MSSPPSPTDKIPDDDETAEAPLTMAASVILTNLPRDARGALEEVGVGRGVPEKGV